MLHPQLGFPPRRFLLVSQRTRRQVLQRLSGRRLVVVVAFRGLNDALLPSTVGCPCVLVIVIATLPLELGYSHLVLRKGVRVFLVGRYVFRRIVSCGFGFRCRVLLCSLVYIVVVL